MTRATLRRRGGGAVRAAAALSLVLGAVVLPTIANASTSLEPAEATADDPIAVAILVPIVVPESAGAILTADELREWTAPGGILTARLEAVSGTAATLAIDPRVTASIRLLGDEAPDSALSWLAALDALPNEAVALGWADTDVAGLSAIERPELAAPSSLQFAVDESRFLVPPVAPVPSASTASPGSASPAPAESATPTPSPTATSPAPVEPNVPSDDELLAVPDAIDAVWGGATGLTADAVTLGDTSLAVDAALSRAADAGTLSLSSAARGAFLDSLVASDSSAVLLGLSRTATADPSELELLLRLVSNDERVEVVGLSAYAELRGAAVVDDDAIDTSSAEATERRELLARMVTSSDAEARVASVTPDPSAFLDERRLELLTALSLGRLAASPASEEAFLDGSLAVRSAVRLAETSDLLVLSNTTGLPVTIVNGLSVPVTVQLDARPLRPLLRIQDVPREVTVEPGSSQTVYLPAQAVTNGRADVVAVLRNSAGERVGPERVIHVDLQAQWEAIGVAVLVLLGVILAAGIANNIVKRRRAAKAETLAEAKGESSGD